MYCKGSIYKMICKTDNKFIYIGSTFSELRHRWQSHKNDYKRWLSGKSKKKCYCYDYFKKYGIENFVMVKIKDYMVYREHNKDSKHLHAYEQLWINKSKSCCNVNSSFNPLSNHKIYYKQNADKLIEKQKIYNKKNKDKISEINKKYYDENKDELKIYHKIYREENKDKIKKKASQKIECEICGSIVRRSYITNHKKTDKCKSNSKPKKTKKKKLIIVA